MLKLQQDQIWQAGDKLLRITRLERLEVDYKVLENIYTKNAKTVTATKKEFCRLIKGASLFTGQDPMPESTPEPEVN